MTHENAALHYLVPNEAACWRWGDGGQALEWPTGETIAFRTEVLSVLEQMVSNGVPHFSAVVLGLGFCRNSSTAYAVGDAKAQQDFDYCWKRFAAIPAQYRLQKKAILLDGIFEGIPWRWAPSESAQIVDAMRRLAPTELTSVIADASKRIDVPQSLVMLRTALENFDLEGWERRTRTSLEDVPRQPDLDVPDGQRIRDLLLELADDTELSGLAALARNLLAAVSVPRPVSAHEELPIGGISDISNRGSLDRLIPSELAHDDLTLSVRVALNEALYWRRESPPRNPPNVRCLLVDCGVRLWGLPRLFGTAVSLAMAATVEVGGGLQTWMAQAAEAVPAEFRTREGLLKSLEYLSPAIHPGEALKSFLEQTDQHAGAERILVTSDDTFDDPDFLRALAEADRPLLVATVNRVGDYVLWASTRRDRRQISRAKLDLEVLYSQPKRIQVRPADDRLPLIFALPELPLRLPHPRPDFSRMQYLPALGVACITNDGRLTLWDKAGWGSRQLSDQLPSKEPLGMGYFGYHLNVLFGPTVSRSARLFRCHVVVPKTKEETLPELITPTYSAQRHGNVFLFEQSQSQRLQRVQVVALSSGEVMVNHRPPGNLTWLNHRFVVEEGGDVFAGASEGSSTFVKLPKVVGAAGDRLVGYVDSPNGPIRLSVRGEVLTAQRCQERGEQPNPVVFPLGGQLSASLEIRGTSHDNRRVWVALKGRSSPAWVLELATGQWEQAHFNPWHQLEKEHASLVRDVTLRSHVESLFVEGMTLCLKMRRGSRFGIRLAGTRQPTMSLVALPGSGDYRDDACRFEPHDGPSGVHYALHRAVSPSGAKAFTDSRGLLHLVPGSATQPQLCLAITAEGSIAGWVSTGEIHGSPLFTADKVTVPADRLFQYVTRFAQEWMGLRTSLT